MLLLLICFAMIALGLFLYNVLKCEDAWLLPLLLGCIALFLSICGLIVSYSTKDYCQAALIESRKSLVYQAESKLYLKENQIGLKELADQIQEWNEDLAGCRAAKESLWVNIFYPIDYSEFDFIDLSILNEGK